MKKITTLIAVLLLILSILSTAIAQDANGPDLEAWACDADWSSFHTYAQDDALADAWSDAAAAFGPLIGMEDLTGEAMRALNIQACGFEDGTVRLHFDGDTITALDADGNAVFSHAYAYTATLEGALEGKSVYVYATEDGGAGDYTYLCMTLPGVESDEGGVVTNFSLRCCESDYEALFSETYGGATHVFVRADTPIEDIAYTIRLVYASGTED